MLKNSMEKNVMERLWSTGKWSTPFPCPTEMYPFGGNTGCWPSEYFSVSWSSPNGCEASFPACVDSDVFWFFQEDLLEFLLHMWFLDMWVCYRGLTMWSGGCWREGYIFLRNFLSPKNCWVIKLGTGNNLGKEWSIYSLNPERPREEKWQMSGICGPYICSTYAPKFLAF